MKALPNILLVVCDTLGAKHMSLYGYPKKTTPNLEKMVKEDNFVIYKMCFSPSPWTVPSHVSLFTGLYPSEHGVDGLNMFMPSNIITFTEILKATGYYTFGFSCNSLICDFFGFSKGFDKFYEMWNLFAENNNFYDKLKINGTSLEKFKFLITKALNIKNNTLFDYKEIVKHLFLLFSNVFFKQLKPVSKNATFFTSKTIKKIMKLLETIIREKKPFFIFVNLMQTHDKYNPPKTYRNIFVRENKIYEKKHRITDEYDHYAKKPFEIDYLEYLTGLYDQEILFLDTMINKLYIFLKSKEIWNNTLFIITSDHGELFGEHGHIHHLFTTYNELIHIPLIIKYPREIKIENGENFDLVQLNDIYSTILDIINAPYPKPESSNSLLSPEKRRIVISELLDINFKIEACLKRNPKFDVKIYPTIASEVSIINKNLLKFIKRNNQYHELYDLQKDFYEENNLLTKNTFNKEKIEEILKKEFI